MDRNHNGLTFRFKKLQITWSPIRRHAKTEGIVRWRQVDTVRTERRDVGRIGRIRTESETDSSRLATSDGMRLQKEAKIGTGSITLYPYILPLSINGST